MKTITAQTFNTRLSSFIKSQKTQRDTLQALLVFGLAFYKGDITGESGDTGYLSSIMNSCIGVKSLPSNTIKDYIKAHANVKWGKSVKKGSTALVFTKSSKVVEVELPTQTWYDYHSEKNTVTTDYDETKSIKMLMDTITKRIKSGHIKNEEHGKEALAVLSGLSFLKA